jgi:multidrug efflux pump subunit AcrB
LLISLSGSAQTAPNFWLNPENGVSYPIAVQTPQFRVSSVGDIEQTPISIGNSLPPQLISNMVSIRRGATPMIVSHYNVQPIFDVYAGVQNRDLGAVAAQVQKITDEFKGQLPRGTTLVMRGQVQSMQSSFTGLFLGISFAIVLIYFLLVINFQSWLDPFIIITALPGAITGIVWMLFLTGTTLSVPALTGAIMCVGVATSNSILVVTFANEQQLDEGKNAFAAARAAGFTRLRPVLMTALAMILGMLPMSLGLGEGGEQNAPLGRAVIGGLLVATFFTLFFVPVVYRLLKVNARRLELHPRLREPGVEHKTTGEGAPTAEPPSHAH